MCFCFFTYQSTKVSVSEKQFLVDYKVVPYIGLVLHCLRQGSKQRHHLWVAQYLCKHFRIHAFRYCNGGPGMMFIPSHLRVQILLPVKCFLKQLSVFSSVFVDDVGVDVGHHGDLGVVAGCFFTRSFANIYNSINPVKTTVL